MNATIAYTSSRHQDALVGIARIAAAGRVQAARQAAEARRAEVQRTRRTLASIYVREAVKAGATRLGMKVCFEEGGKWRTSMTPDEALTMLPGVLGEDVEVWGLNDANEYVWSMW